METREERFIRVAEKRVNRVIKDIKLISQCSNKSMYNYDDAQLRKIWRAIDNSLNIADKNDVQVMIHTDTLNESGFVENTIKAINKRTIHAFHTEGAGGGHAPDIIKLVGEKNVFPSSTLEPWQPIYSSILLNLSPLARIQ